MRVLSVTHGPSVGGGVFDETVVQEGHELQRWVVPLGGRAPEPARHDAVLVFGGGMHPDEDSSHPWLAPEVAFLHDALEAGVPTLGICLGAQLVARAAGGWVGRASVAEVGWLPVELTTAGRADPVLGTLPSPVDAFQWHHYTFGLPAGATELATSQVCTQAFALDGRAWGIQFHAEVTRAMIEAWVAEDPTDLRRPADELLAETGSRIDAWNDHGRALCRNFLAAAAV